MKDALAQGPKEVQAVEEAAAKAHIDDQVLAQARADLGVIPSRATGEKSRRAEARVRRPL